MALAVDRADRLIDEVFRETVHLFSTARDGLAIIGAFYVVKKVINISYNVFSMIKIHVMSRIFRVDLKEKYGPWAVVTGCTSGIGLAFCEELAARGINIVLISRSLSKLSAVIQTLESRFNVRVTAIVADFSEGPSVYDNIRKQLDGKDIGILVNNVGVAYDYPMNFLDITEQKIWELVNVNVAAATVMTHIVLPGMVERGRGAVVTMASGASTMPTPLIAVYSATKAYLDYFCRAISYEYKKRGITVQCLMPYYIATGMTQYSTTLPRPNLIIPSPNTFVRHALSTLGWVDRTPGYLPHVLQMWIAHHLPEWLWMWGGNRLNDALREQAEIRIRHRSGSNPSNQMKTSRSSSAASVSSIGDPVL
ncbi:hypothetical protein LSH36_193g15007 [Paralvinella palmiformis]|uniref:Uncharacterized protein n=1 Tax=Paralvinella palmiformis TaxID=53620 RepID=A0AAD9JR48_9ANNE|nr:hypothetical protein LSH36_193g15007 [Paralvinella palmiformis]